MFTEKISPNLLSQTTSPKLRESQLVEVIKENASKFVRSNKWYMTTELNSGYGIADVVFYRVNQSEINERLSKRLKEPIISREAVRTILAVKEFNKPVSVSYLTRQLGISENTIKYSIMRFLMEQGYILREDKFYRLAHPYHEISSEAIAVEAKISDWQRGLYQAYRYKWYSSKSYLALYHKHLNPALKNISKFKALNVGLLSVSDNSIKVIYDPRTETPRSLDTFALISERIFSSHLRKPVPVSR